MSNLAERIATRNTCEKFYCEHLYPVLNALMVDIAQRELDTGKMILQTGKFSKAAQAIIDPVIAELRADMPKNMRIIITKVYSEIRCDIDYTLPCAVGSGCNYVSLYFPTMYLSQEYIDQRAKIIPPVFSPVSEALVADCRATMLRTRKEIEELAVLLATAESILNNVGEPT